MWLGSRSFQESPVWRKHQICQVEVTFCRMGLLAHNLLDFDGLAPVLFGVLGDRTWGQMSSALCLSIRDGGLGVWLSATQSIECLLPLEWIPLELLHSWLGSVAPYGNHELQLLDPQCSPAPWAESRWLFKPRLENVGLRDWSSCVLGWVWTAPVFQSSPQSVVQCRNFLYGFFWDCILKLCTCIGYSVFNCGGKKHLNHLTFVQELLGIGFLLHLLLTPGSVAPWPFLLGNLFLLKAVLVFFFPSHLRFSTVSVLSLSGIVPSELLKVCLAMGWCLPWVYRRILGGFGALSDKQIWFVFCHKRGILSTLKSVGKNCHVRGNISVII